MAKPNDFKPMTMSGFCQHPSTENDSHQFCRYDGCTCKDPNCHTKEDK